MPAIFKNVWSKWNSALQQSDHRIQVNSRRRLVPKYHLPSPRNLDLGLQLGRFGTKELRLPVFRYLTTGWNRSRSVKVLESDDSEYNSTAPG